MGVDPGGVVNSVPAPEQLQTTKTCFVPSCRFSDGAQKSTVILNIEEHISTLKEQYMQ